MGDHAIAETDMPFEAWALDHPDRVLSLDEWAALACISKSNAEKMIARGEGPTITRMSRKRIGVRLRHHAAWLDQCAEHRQREEVEKETA